MLHARDCAVLQEQRNNGKTSALILLNPRKEMNKHRDMQHALEASVKAFAKKEATEMGLCIILTFSILQNMGDSWIPQLAREQL